jgi:hypothetical protein
MALLSQLINLRCTTRPSDPCLLDISCCKLLIGEAHIPTAAVAMYGLQQGSVHVNQLLNTSRATMMDVARGKVRSPKKKQGKEEVYWTQLRELAMPPALSMLSLGHVIVFCQMLDIIVTGALHARLLHKVMVVKVCIMLLQGWLLHKISLVACKVLPAPNSCLRTEQGAPGLCLSQLLHIP